MSKSILKDDCAGRNFGIEARSRREHMPEPMKVLMDYLDKIRDYARETVGEDNQEYEQWSKKIDAVEELINPSQFPSTDEDIYGTGSR